MRISDWSSDVCSSDLVCGLDLVWLQFSGLGHQRSRFSVDDERIDLVGTIRIAARVHDRDRISHSPIDLLLFNFENIAFRSEEHTSELPSLVRNSYAVFPFKKKRTPPT